MSYQRKKKPCPAARLARQKIKIAEISSSQDCVSCGSGSRWSESDHREIKIRFLETTGFVFNFQEGKRRIRIRTKIPSLFRIRITNAGQEIGLVGLTCRQKNIFFRSYTFRFFCWLNPNKSISHDNIFFTTWIENKYHREISLFLSPIWLPKLNFKLSVGYYEEAAKQSFFSGPNTESLTRPPLEISGHRTFF